MSNKVYWCSIEYSYKENPSELVDLKGGFVYSFVSAFDAKEALDKVALAMEDKKLSPVEIEFISPYDPETEWETEEEAERFLGLFNEAEETTEVLFDDFYAYEEE